MAAPHLSPLSHIRRAEIRFSSSYSYATCPSRMKKTSPLLSSSSSSSISSEKDKGKAIAASSLPFLLKIHPRGVRRNLRLRCHRRLKQGTLAIVISSSPKTSGSVWGATFTSFTTLNGRSLVWDVIFAPLSPRFFRSRCMRRPKTLDFRPRFPSHVRPKHKTELNLRAAQQIKEWFADPNISRGSYSTESTNQHWKG